MTAIDAATLAAIRARYGNTSMPRDCPNCGAPAYRTLTRAGMRAYCTAQCPWQLELQDGDPAVLALADAYVDKCAELEALLARLRAVKCHTNSEYLALFSQVHLSDEVWQFSDRFDLARDATTLAALVAEVAEGAAQ